MGKTINNNEIIAEALTRAGIFDRVNSLKHSANTVLTREFDDEGEVLSDGEFQKIAVARAFANLAPIKIFDKPSSALDPIAEYHLNRSMAKAAKNKSVIFISHRLSATRYGDKIFMLEKGWVIEEGIHESLLEANGKYAEVWRA